MTGLVIMTMVTMCCTCVLSFASVDKQNEEHFHGPVTLIKNLVNICFCLAVNVIAWMAYSQIQTVSAEDVNLAANGGCAEEGSYLHAGLKGFQDFNGSSTSVLATIVGFSCIQIALYFLNVFLLFFGEKIFGSSHEQYQEVQVNTAVQDDNFERQN